MAVFKIINSSYTNLDAVEKTITYITGNNTTEDKVYDVGGIGVDCYNYQNAISQYHIVKNVWNKTDKRQVLHFVVSFEEAREEWLTLSDIALLAYQIGKILSKEQFQIMWGIHTNTKHIHVHYIVNSVSYVTGSKYRLDWKENYAIFQEIQRVIQSYLSRTVQTMEEFEND